MAASDKILEERKTVFEGMSDVLEKLDAGKAITVEERANFEARRARMAELQTQYKDAKAAEELAAEMRSERGSEVKGQHIDHEARANSAFTSYLRGGDQAKEWQEFRAGTGSSFPLSAGSVAPNYIPTPGSTGGYTVPPAFWNRLQIALKVFGGIANDFLPIETSTGAPLQWMTQDPTSVVGQLVSNTSQTPPTPAPATQDYAFGAGQLAAYDFSSGIQLFSRQFIQDTAIDVDGFIAQRVGESLGRAMALEAVGGQGTTASVPGSGNTRPLGILTALTAKGAWSAGGSGGYVTVTSDGVQIGTVTGTPGSDNTLGPASLRKMIQAVDPGYRVQGAKFYMNDAQLLGLRAQTDSNGRPLVNMQDGVTPGVPASVWGYEIVVDNNIPNINAATTTTVVGGPVFGHLASAMVNRTVLGIDLKVLNERYADTLQIGYIGFQRYDIRSNDLRSAVTVLS